MGKEIIEYKESDDIIADLKKIIEAGRTLSYEAVAKIMVATYWNISRQIVVFEQNGKNRAEYGTSLIDKLSKELTYVYGKGFSPGNLREYRKFYELFPDPEIWHSRVPNINKKQKLLGVVNETTIQRPKFSVRGGKGCRGCF